MRRASEFLSLSRRDEGQDVGFSSRPFVLTALPIRQLHVQTEYVRRNGRYTLRMWTKAGISLPFGHDRIILLWLVTMAVRQQSPVLHFSTPVELLDMFGMQKGGHEYRRLIEGFRRLYYTSMSFEVEGAIGGVRVEFFSEMKLWFDPDVPDTQYTLGFQNTVVLSDRFWKEVKEHPIPVDLTIVKKLIDSPGNLDFYIWLVWRCWCAKTPCRIPLFDAAGLFGQFGVSEKTPRFEFRRRIRQWLATTVLHWPECPARLEGDFLVVSHKKAVESRAFPRDQAHEI